MINFQSHKTKYNKLKLSIYNLLEYIQFIYNKTHFYILFFFQLLSLKKPQRRLHSILSLSKKKNNTQNLLCFYPLLFKLAIVDEQSTFHVIKPKNHTTMGSGRPKDEDFDRWPPWLKPLLREKFFVPCKFHPNSHKNECNLYCLDCMNPPICALCLPHHTNHCAIQIRRSSYNDVVRASDIQKMIDISGIQTYIINSARVVFLNERPQSRPGKGVNNTCQVCERSLLDIFRFCSLGCKIVGTSKNFKESKKLRTSSRSDSEDSCSTSSTTTREEMMNNYNNNVVHSFAQIPPQISLNCRKRRRKGTPHRAPLF